MDDEITVYAFDTKYARCPIRTYRKIKEPSTMIHGSTEEFFFFRSLVKVHERALFCLGYYCYFTDGKRITR